MKIGDKVTVKNRLSKTKDFVAIGRVMIKRVEWAPLPFLRPVPSALYLGTITLYNGTVRWEGDDVGWVFDRTGQVSAVVVQPLGAGVRYRRPVYALPEDVEAVQP